MHYVERVEKEGGGFYKEVRQSHNQPRSQGKALGTKLSHNTMRREKRRLGTTQRVYMVNTSRSLGERESMRKHQLKASIFIALASVKFRMRALGWYSFNGPFGGGRVYTWRKLRISKLLGFDNNDSMKQEANGGGGACPQNSIIVTPPPPPRVGYTAYLRW